MGKRRKMSREFEVAILGAGTIGMLHAENILTSIPSLKLRAVADPVSDAVQQAHERFGVRVERDWHAAVDDPKLDAVIICSPMNHHAEQIREAVATGKHIFCEKPIDWRLEIIDDLLRDVEEQGVIFQTGFNRRFDRNFASLWQKVTENRLGDLWTLKITSRDPELPGKDYLKSSGGLFLDMTIHDFDMARFLARAEIREVTARASALVSAETGEADDVDTALTVLCFDNDVLAVIDNCRKSAYGYDQRIEVHGERGTMFADNEVTDTTSFWDSSGSHRPPVPHFFLERYKEAYKLELESFGRALAGGPVAVSGHDGRQAVLAAIAANRSLRENRTVTLAEVAEGTGK